MLRRTGFARLGARSVAPQRRAYARRAARRRVQWTRNVHNVFTEPTGRKSVPARANKEEHERASPKDCYASAFVESEQAVSSSGLASGLRKQGRFDCLPASHAAGTPISMRTTARLLSLACPRFVWRRRVHVQLYSCIWCIYAEKTLFSRVSN